MIYYPGYIQGCCSCNLIVLIGGGGGEGVNIDMLIFLLARLISFEINPKTTYFKKSL